MSATDPLEDVKELARKCEALEKEKEDFGQKRGMFMELFKQKEDELQQAHTASSEAIAKAQSLEESLKKLQLELDDVKTAATISEIAKQDEIQDVRDAARQEIASMEHIMKEGISQAKEAARAAVEQERGQWAELKERYESSGRLSPDRDGFLSSVAKTLHKRVAAASPLSGTGGLSQTELDQENLEDSMKKAQEDTEILKSVVMPLEEEITTLKQKLRDAFVQLDHLEGTKSDLPGITGADSTFQGVDCPVPGADGSAPGADGIVPGADGTVSGADGSVPGAGTIVPGKADYKEKMKELNESLRTEKSSRTDLEMYVAVLNTQKAVLQDDSDKLHTELKEVCKLLEIERREHNDLKHTWQMANDQFLEAQCLMMNDMRRIESVLSVEQQRQVTEMKQKEDSVRKARHRDEQLKSAEEKARASSEEHGSSDTGDDQADTTLDTTVYTDDSFNMSADLHRDLRRSQSNQSFSSLVGINLADDTRSLEGRLIHEDSLRSSPDKSIVIPSLTEAQERSITDPTPESEASHMLLAQAKAKHEVTINLSGKRIVSDKEWIAMQQEVRGSREKLGKPCNMCHNYETQLQSVQDSERKTQNQVRTLERQLQAERQAIVNQTTYTETLEENLKTVAEDAKGQISTLLRKVDDSEKYVTAFRQQFSQAQSELHDQLKVLTENREEIHKELLQLQKENDELVGRHSKHAQQMQEESIDLPNNIEELHLLLLRYREDIIKAKVAKEHIEDMLRSEIMFLKDQVLAEQQEKSTMEETLSQEISQLQEELATLQSYKSETERQSSLRSEAETKVKDLEASLKSIQAKSKQLIGALQHQVEEQIKAKSALEAEVHRMKVKVSSLQVDLDNSEAVQRDFVKLSQSLQIQLEKFRAGEDQVRWQFEEDVDDCMNCKLPFTVTRRKHHCRHCGKIFCSDCLGKIVNSGPNLRPSKVCDICHTMLVSEATPYFSTVPPKMND